MTSLVHLWRTTTVRLTALFLLIFVVFSVGLLAYTAWQSSIAIQQQQIADIDREVNQLVGIDRQFGVRQLVFAMQRLAARPGPGGIYYLGDDAGRMLIGNVEAIPREILAEAGRFTFSYDRGLGIATEEMGFAMVRTAVLDSGLRLVVGRDIVERRGFSAIVFGGFVIGAAGIVVLSLVTGIVVSMRVLRRIDSIAETSAKIMSGNLSERVPVTSRNDEFDRLATSLNDMLDRIEQLMIGLKAISENVAHDLKTPLTRLRNQAERALSEAHDPEAHRAALETTIRESDQLIRVFNALLMIARAEAGAPSGAFSDVDISAVAEDMADLYAPLAEDAGIALTTEIASGLHLRANRELIGQALVNLLDNAIKYARTGEDDAVGITMRAARENGRLVISVADNGQGIAAEERERVVERFVRLEKSRTEPGSGLGLSLVDAVARLHKGSFRIEDNGPGVRAVIDLPAA